jgi:NTE family protein
MTELLSYMRSLSFTKFMPEGRLHQLLDHVSERTGDLVADAAILTHRMGIYSGDYLTEWLAPILHNELGIRSFADLKLSSEVDPDLSLPPGHEYSLVVNVSDITRRQLVRLPWDYPLYGHVADDEDPVEAVRASISIPLFFEPVRFVANPTELDVPLPTGGTTRVHYAGGSVTWVDGGLLESCSTAAFDRIDGRSPRRPTIGVKLSDLGREISPTKACGSALAVGIGCVQTLMSEWDSYTTDRRRQPEPSSLTMRP